MRRNDRAQSLEFSLALIDRCTHGVVAFASEDAPYCIPLSLIRIDNALYFHCAREGKKLELLRKNNQVCVTFVGNDSPAFVADKQYYTTYFESVLVTGRAFEVTSSEEKILALRRLCEVRTPDGMTGDHFDHAVAASLSRVVVFRIDMDEITGKAKFKPNNNP